MTSAEWAELVVAGVHDLRNTREELWAWRQQALAYLHQLHAALRERDRLAASLHRLREEMRQRGYRGAA